MPDPSTPTSAIADCRLQIAGYDERVERELMIERRAAQIDTTAQGWYDMVST
jgi:hypothetical protein